MAHDKRNDDRCESDHRSMIKLEPPPGLGDLDALSMEELDDFTSDENGARKLQGVIFYDTELGWCRVTGWGAECGTIIAFYVPMDASDIVLDEQFVPVDELISLIE